MVATREMNGRKTRKVILALPDSSETTALTDRIRQAGWTVYQAADCEGLRRLACRVAPEVVVLRADGGDESGWLTCAKLMRTIPRLRVIVVGTLSADGTEFARFVGANLVRGDVSADELAESITDSAMSAG